ncbi:helix-turn-helix domain-containing protein [Gemmata algarum]|uniref:helix-turn-helix domain-containing protein n=1 Tax=Gemmata algarum TaxID=2975278 RepID=UPI0038B4010F
MRGVLSAPRSAEAATMTTEGDSPALALRPRDAARVLGVSARTLWGWTQAGLVPCVRVGSGKRKTVLYPVADLQAWLTRQSEAAKGGN